MRYNRSRVTTFSKYQGLGNDFVVLDLRQGQGDLDAATSRRWCDRHFGVGADGVLTILADQATGLPRMVVHNADGSVAEMCGNGLRCVVKHLAEASGGRPSGMAVATGAGVLQSEISWVDGRVAAVTVAMGPARFEAPILPRGGPFISQPVDGAGLVGTAVSMGNPHLVLLDCPPSEAARLGPSLERHPLFVQRTNVEFVRPRDDRDGGLEVTVWERGVGLTLACGTGACAAVAASVRDGRVAAERWVPVRLPGGVLDIKVAADFSQVWLRGPVERVYEGSFS